MKEEELKAVPFSVHAMSGELDPELEVSLATNPE